MGIPPYVVELRRAVGHTELWLPGVTAVVTRGDGTDQEVLLVRRADDGSWTPVTGIVDPGEEPGAAARREALEETGVEIRVDRLAEVSAGQRVTYDNGDRAVYLDHTFACTWLAGEAHVADDESSDVRWYPRHGLPEMGPRMRHRIEVATSGESVTRFGS